MLKHVSKTLQNYSMVWLKHIVLSGTSRSKAKPTWSDVSFGTTYQTPKDQQRHVITLSTSGY